MLWTVVLKKTLENLLDCTEIQPVHSKGNQSWIFIGRTDIEAETPILWPPDAKSWLIGKDSVAEKDWRREEKETTEDEMVGWHHRLNGCVFEQALGRWLWTGRPGVLQSMGLQIVGHNWATEHQQQILRPHPRPSRSESRVEVPPLVFRQVLQVTLIHSPLWELLYSKTPNDLISVTDELSAYYRDELYITVSIMHDESRS